VKQPSDDLQVYSREWHDNAYRHHLPTYQEEYEQALQDEGYTHPETLDDDAYGAYFIGLVTQMVIAQIEEIPRFCFNERAALLLQNELSPDLQHQLLLLCVKSDEYKQFIQEHLPELPQPIGLRTQRWSIWACHQIMFGTEEKAISAAELSRDLYLGEHGPFKHQHLSDLPLLSCLCEKVGVASASELNEHVYAGIEDVLDITYLRREESNLAGNGNGASE